MINRDCNGSDSTFNVLEEVPVCQNIDGVVLEVRLVPSHSIPMTIRHQLLLVLVQQGTGP